MKITTVEVFAFKYDHHYRLGGHAGSPNRLPGTDYYFEPQWKHAYSRVTESCLVKITTDTGIVGWGEAQAPLVPEVPATLIAKLMGPAIIGLDPGNTDEIYDRLYHLSHVRGHTASYTIDAITGIDIALWDIKGKAAQKPLNQLLGAVYAQRLPLYVSGLRQPEPLLRQELAREVAGAGFRGIKLFMGADPEKVISEFQSIRLAVGEEIELAFDGICRYEYEDALKIGSGLDELSAAWFEAPLDPQDIEGHARLATNIKTPVAIGEPLRTVHEFRPWLKAEAMKVSQPDVVRCGITGSKRIIQLAVEADQLIAPHIGICTGIGVAATWHITSSLKNPAKQEHQLDMFETANKVLNNALQVEDGKALVPTGAGLGVDVNEAFVIQHSKERWTVTATGTIHHIT